MVGKITLYLTSGCFANSWNSVFRNRTISDDSLLTIVLVCLSQNTGTVYLPVRSRANLLKTYLQADATRHKRRSDTDRAEARHSQHARRQYRQCLYENNRSRCRHDACVTLPDKRMVRLSFVPKVSSQASYRSRMNLAPMFGSASQAIGGKLPMPASKAREAWPHACQQ